MQVIVLLGPTGVGKTKRSVELATHHGCPVVVLDRVQCLPQLAVGSGRPRPEELAGTRRLYLAERTTAEGPLGAGEAVERLEGLLDRLAEESETVVLEGGSISILEELLAQPGWMAGHTVQVISLLERSPRAYERQVARRVEGMLGYRRTGPTILDEVASLWDDQPARNQLRNVLGYREILGQCALHNISPRSLTGSPGALARYLMADPILQAHLHYSREQRMAMLAAMPRLAELGCAVGVHTQPAPRRSHSPVGVAARPLGQRRARPADVDGELSCEHGELTA